MADLNWPEILILLDISILYYFKITKYVLYERIHNVNIVPLKNLAEFLYRVIIITLIKVIPFILETK